MYEAYDAYLSTGPSADTLRVHIAGFLYIIGFFIGICGTQGTSLYSFICAECISVAMIAVSSYIMMVEESRLQPQRRAVGPECKG